MTFMPNEIDMSKQYEELWNAGKLQCVNTTNMSIPPDTSNMDYARYLEWKKLGGIPKVTDITIVKTLSDLRKEEYVKQGVTTDALIVALWEKVVEDRPEAADALQALREDVKLQLPK